MTKRYNILTRCLAAFALMLVYVVSTSAILVGTSTTQAEAGGGVAASIFAEADATGATAGPDTSARIDRGLSATIIVHDPNRKSGVSVSPARLICFLADRESNAQRMRSMIASHP